VLGLMIACWLSFALLSTASAQPSAETLAEKAFALLQGDPARRREAIQALIDSKRADAAPFLILALRFSQREPGSEIVQALEMLTGARPGGRWSDWMLWQEAHPEIGVMPGFGMYQARLYDLIDPNFQYFLSGMEKHDIRLEEITWGGVLKDGIPALTHPKLIPAAEATYLDAGDLVFGIEINGDVRAYPLRIMDWHEMFNDVVGGVPVSLAYCTLCGSGILYETTVRGWPEPIIFGSSGFLYRSNKLMYDTATHSLWNQFTGRPVVGSLTGSGIVLATRPVAITRWSDWKALHPAGKVLALDTGHPRDYSAGAAYGQYFASPELMFPTIVDTTKLRPKDYVFVLRSAAVEKAWPLRLFEGGAVINDRAGVLDLVLIGNAATRTVRAYRSQGLNFEHVQSPNQVKHGAELWQIREDALVAPDGRALPRLPGHIAYWFAWSGYFGRDGELADSAPAARR